MQAIRRRVVLGVALTLLAVCGAAAAAVTGAERAAVKLRHAQSGFTVEAPPGFSLGLRNGVYLLRKGNVTISVAWLVTNATPGQVGSALMQALRGRVLVRAGDARHFVGAVAGGGRNDHFVVERVGKRLAVTANTSRGVPVALEALRAIGLSARGGVGLRAPKAQTQQSIPLRPYRAPDGGATALVPAGNDWIIQSGQGRIDGSSPRGAFVFGLSVNIPLSAPGAVPSTVIVGPYLSAVQALTQIIPRLVPGITNMRVRRVLVDGALPSFTSSGMLQYDYRVGGRRWTGLATVGTDSPEKYSNFLWNFYFSGIGVPVGSDPAVGVGLLRSWRSWDPSGAIAQRTRAAIQLLNETNAIFQETSEFRSRIADQQSRDVGCLLSGYYIIEDNARRYGLPPLPCGQIYTERN
ncbi:MAG: hypothetical protein ACKVUT_04040 [Gaiella sp.]